MVGIWRYIPDDLQLTETSLTSHTVPKRPVPGFKQGMAEAPANDFPLDPIAGSSHSLFALACA
jgi:hypothetical protein